VPNPGEAPQIELNLPATITVGSRVQTQITVSGGSGNYTYQVSGQLPTGLTLHPDGRLEGWVTQVGTYTFTILVTDGNGLTTTQTVEIVIERMYIFVPIITKATPANAPLPMQIFVPIVMRTTPQ